MTTYTYKGGVWYNKMTGLPEEPPNRMDSWNGGCSLQITPNMEPYNCPITGKYIDSMHKHRENLKLHGCRVLEPGESREAPRRREESLKSSIDKAVNRMMQRAANEFC